jgi:hypothetical protein
MDTTNGLKSYCLDREELELLLQTDYGDKIQPVDHEKLLKQQRQQQRIATMTNMFKNKRAEVIPEKELNADPCDVEK